MLTYFFLFLITILNIFLLLKFDYYSRFFKIEDRPDKIRKIHKKNIKVLGGTIIFLNLILYSFFYLCLNEVYLEELYGSKSEFLTFFLSALSIYVIGLLDDKNNIPALNKLILTVLVISISLFLNKKIITEINLSFYEHKIILGQYSFLFTLFCYVIFINAFNMLDGINLQAGLYSLFLILVMISFGLDAILAFCILLGILVYINFNRQDKIFLGDNGCLLLSYIISYFMIDLFNQRQIIFSDTILLLLLIPGLEIIRLSFERIKNNRNIISPDRRHIHHIIKFNDSEIKGVVIIQILIIVPYLLSVSFDNKLPIILVTIFTYFLLIFYFRKNDAV